jgi:hypothetical protein
MLRILFVFLDGVGLGPADEEINPLVAAELPAFRRLAGGHPWSAATPTLVRDRHVFRPIDATLGMPGLPQSGTGQASLFTGVNGARLAGRHYGPYPHSRTRSDNLINRDASWQANAMDIAEDAPKFLTSISFLVYFSVTALQHLKSYSQLLATTQDGNLVST